MALQGTLETFALPDVLRLLASTKKTGALRVDTARGHGELMVRDGELVGGSAERSPRAETPPDVLFEMLRSNDGSFVFDSDAPVDSDGDAQDVESALSAAESQLAEWTEIEAVVPSPHRLVTLRPHRDDDITFAPEQWSVVATVAGGCTVAQLADRLDATEMVATRAVRDLVEKGAVDLSDHDADSAPTSVSTMAEDPDDALDVAPSAPASMPSFENPPEAPSMPSFGSEPDSLLAEEPAPLPPLPTRQPLSEVATNRFAPPSEDAPVASVAPLFGDPAPAEEAPAEAAPTGDEGSNWTPGNFGDDSSSFFDDDEDPLADDPFGPDPFRLPRLPGQDESGDDTEASEMARQLANLSPRAAQAVAAAAAATTDEERDEALAQATEGDDGVNRGLLLKFLSSVDE